MFEVFVYEERIIFFEVVFYEDLYVVEIIDIVIFEIIIEIELEGVDYVEVEIE